MEFNSSARGTFLQNRPQMSLRCHFNGHVGLNSEYIHHVRKTLILAVEPQQLWSHLK